MIILSSNFRIDEIGNFCCCGLMFFDVWEFFVFDIYFVIFLS